jgi:hypothetical protein
MPRGGRVCDRCSAETSCSVVQGVPPRPLPQVLARSTLGRRRRGGVPD